MKPDYKRHRPTVRSPIVSLVPQRIQRRDDTRKLAKSLVFIAHAAGLRLKRIDHILLMIDGEYSSPVYLDFHGRLVTIRKPKAINSLILPDKISSIDPEGWLFSGVAGDFHNCEVLGVDPYFPLEQILLPAFRSSLENKAMIRADVVFAGQCKRVVRRGNRTVAMLPAGRRLALALDQAIKHQVTHDPRSFFGGLVERFLVRRLVVHTHYRLRGQFPLRISDLVRSDRRVPSQLLVSQPVMFQHSCNNRIAR